MPSLSNSSNGTLCSSDRAGSALSYTFLALSLLILCVLGLTQRRRRLLRGFLCGVPGVVVPVNLLTAAPYRFVYAATFGAMTGDVVDSYLTSSSFISYSGNAYVSILLRTGVSPLVVTLYLAVKFFPVFACVLPPVPLLGHTLGLLYTCFIIAVRLYGDYRSIHCDDTGSGSAVFSALGQIPVYLCYLVVVVWYVFAVVRDVLTLLLARSRGAGLEACYHGDVAVEDSYYVRYVKKLLRKKHPPRASLVVRAVEYIFPYRTSAAKLPVKFLGAVTITFVFLFQATFTIVGLLLLGSVRLISAWKAVISVGPFVSLVLCFALLVHLCASVFKHIRMLRKGDLSFTFLRELSQSSVSVTASWAYPGYQVAYFLAAFVLYMLLVWLLGAAAYGIYIAFKFVPGYALRVMAGILIPLGWVVLLVLLQMAARKFLFERNEGGRFVVIEHQRIFNWFAYILFFYNSFVGLVSALMRILLSAGFGLLLVMRLDRIVLMRGFEFFDFGHKSYLGFLYLELTYNNPVVHACVAAMSKRVQREERSGHGELQIQVDSEGESSESTQLLTPGRRKGLTSPGATDYSRKVLCRNRWLVAYTLLRNPQLVELRGGQRRRNESRVSRKCKKN